MKGFSTFSGIGGFELGFQRAGVPVEWIGASEIDPYARRIYDLHFSHPHYGDITHIRTESLPDFDLLVGGFPCKSFSTLGRRRGFDDPRGLLFFEIARILRDKQPRFFLLENVKGLVFHRQGATFRVVIQTLEGLGYGVQWQVLDSKDFGVPQHRERVYLVGALGNCPAGEVFPFRQTTARPASGASTPAQTGTAEAVLSPSKRVIRPSCRRFKHAHEPMFTLTAGDKHGVHHQGKVRYLTPTEYERLQGFPDGWTAYGKLPSGEKVRMSDDRRYKALGHAVTVPVIEAIVSRWLKGQVGKDVRVESGRSARS